MSDFTGKCGENLKWHYNYYLDVAKFKSDFLRLCANFRTFDEDENILNDIVEKINHVDCSAVAFLKNIDSIEDKEMQMVCRCAAIVQMFNAKLDYRGGYPYVATSAHSTDLLFLMYSNSTAVVSKYGEVIIDKDEVYLNPRNNYGQGWPILDIASQKYGFITTAGQRALPCVFDVIKQHIGEVNPIYNGGTYNMTIYGSMNKLTKEKIQDLIGFEDGYTPNELYCVSEDGILFRLRPWSQEVPYRRGNIQEVGPVLSDLVLSKAKLEVLLNSK